MFNDDGMGQAMENSFSREASRNSNQRIDWLEMALRETAERVMKLEGRIHILESLKQNLNKGVDYDDALNDAGWKLTEGLQKYGNLTGHQFNNVKGCLKEAIEVYLARKAKDERA